MGPGSDDNAGNGSPDLSDSPLRRRIQAVADSTPSGRDLPRNKPAKRRQERDDARRAIGPLSLIPAMILIVVVWLWILDIIPSPFSLLSSKETGGADSYQALWALVNGLFLALGAGYLFWLGRRLSGLGQYRSPTYPGDDGVSGLRRRKTMSGRILKYLAFAMVLKVIYMLVILASSD